MSPCIPLDSPKKACPLDPTHADREVNAELVTQFRDRARQVGIEEVAARDSCREQNALTEIVEYNLLL